METNSELNPGTARPAKTLQTALPSGRFMTTVTILDNFISVFDVMGLKSFFTAALLQNVQYPSHVIYRFHLVSLDPYPLTVYMRVTELEGLYQ